MKTKPKRLKLLSERERQELYSLPKFDDVEQQYYFSLPSTQLKEIGPWPLSSQLYFILQLGYFCAKRQFFMFHVNRVKEDVKFIMKVYFYDQLAPSKIPSRNIQSRIKKKILALLKYDGSISRAKSVLAQRATELAKYCNNTKEMFRMLLNEVESKNIILPAYTTMQDILSTAIMVEEKRLEKIIQKNLRIDIRHSLDLLLKKEDSFYRLTELKQDLRNFNYKQMGAELKKHNENEKMYQFQGDFCRNLNYHNKTSNTMPL